MRVCVCLCVCACACVCFLVLQVPSATQELRRKCSKQRSEATVWPWGGERLNCSVLVPRNESRWLAVLACCLFRLTDGSGLESMQDERVSAYREDLAEWLAGAASLLLLPPPAHLFIHPPIHALSPQSGFLFIAWLILLFCARVLPLRIPCVLCAGVLNMNITPDTLIRDLGLCSCFRNMCLRLSHANPAPR